MPESPSGGSLPQRDPATTIMKRRGLLAAAWTAIAALVMKATSQPVAAATGMMFAVPRR